MKRTFSILVAFAAICGGATAADLPSLTTAPAYLTAPILTWSGFYVGANVGGGVPASSESGGVIGGGQFGYNYQFLPLFVVGLETDIQGSSAGGGTGSPPFGSAPGGAGPRGVDWFGTVRGRVGATVINPTLLVYGTGGFAYGGSSSARTSWTGGGGLEWAFAPNWSAKAEYLYVDLSDETGFEPHRRGDQAFHVIRAGLNYRFDPFTTLPKSF